MWPVTPTQRCRIYYKISAIWGGHEGSLLLWIVILGGWTVAVAVRSDNLPPAIVARVLSVMGMIGVGFPAVHHS